MSGVRFFKNNVNTDLYVGQNAGERLLSDIEHASKSVKVVSPYLSPVHIEKLINKANKGVSVLLITSDEIEEYRDNSKPLIIKQLIKQIKNTDSNSLKLRKKLLTAVLALIGILAITFVLIIYMVINHNFNIVFGFAFIALLLSVLVLEYIRKNTIVYSYNYEPLFPFRVFVSPYNSKLQFTSNYFIHSKIFIIDDIIAYLGSLNFTRSGLEFNFESQVRITEPATIKGLSDMVNDLFNNNIDKNHYIDIQTWGRALYNEPIN